MVNISYLYGRDGLIIDAIVIFSEDRYFAYISGWSFANESVSNLDSSFASLFQETTPFISSSLCNIDARPAFKDSYSQSAEAIAFRFSR